PLLWDTAAALPTSQALALQDALPNCEHAALHPHLEQRVAGLGLGVAYIPQLTRFGQCRLVAGVEARAQKPAAQLRAVQPRLGRVDRKSTRLNSSHVKISYAVFCLKKK